MLKIINFSLIILLFVVKCSYGDIYYDVVREEWNSFKVQYDKIYKGSIEENYRFKIFMSNLKKIYQHNQRYELGVESYKMKVNEYTDMFDFEIIKLMCGINGTALSEDIKNNKFDGISFIPPASIQKLPDEINWVEKGAVTDVKNQGHCGSCWAFSSTGSLEGQTFRLTNKLVSLSEQNLIDCSHMYGNQGCNGGLMDRAFRYVQDNDGIDTEKSYPYKGIDSNSCKYRKSEKGASCRGYTILPSFDEIQLKTAVATVGPISVAIQATLNFMSYSEGIFYDSLCSDSTDSINHAVLVVGYGTDQRTGLDYWLVKNSWGKVWGMNGYIKMIRNKNNNCNIATFAIYPVL